MYELKRTQQIDDSANMLIQLAHSRPDFVRFNGDNVKCCRCGGLVWNNQHERIAQITGKLAKPEKSRLPRFLRRFCRKSVK